MGSSKDNNKGKIKVVHKGTREIRYIASSKIQDYVDEWDVYTFKDTAASIAYLKKKGFIK